jgi:hypothetical protein
MEAVSCKDCVNFEAEFHALQTASANLADRIRLHCQTATGEDGQQARVGPTHPRHGWDGVVGALKNFAQYQAAPAGVCRADEGHAGAHSSAASKTSSAPTTNPSQYSEE